MSVTIKYNLAVNISHKGILGHESAKNSRLYLLLKLGSGCHLARGSVRSQVEEDSGLPVPHPDGLLVVMAPS